MNWINPLLLLGFFDLLGFPTNYGWEAGLFIWLESTKPFVLIEFVCFCWVMNCINPLFLFGVFGLLGFPSNYGWEAGLFIWLESTKPFVFIYFFCFVGSWVAQTLYVYLFFLVFWFSEQLWLGGWPSHSCSENPTNLKNQIKIKGLCNSWPNNSIKTNGLVLSSHMNKPACQLEESERSSLQI